MSSIQIYITKFENIPEWLFILEQNYEIFGPVRGTDNLVRFQKVKDPHGLEWNYTGSLLPPKKYFFPMEETLFSFKDGKIQTENGEEEISPAKKKILFGVHPCDLNSFNLLDKSMKDGVKDSLYFSRREEVLTVGINCLPDEFCFCDLMETSDALSHKGTDIFLTVVDGKAYAEFYTEEGKQLLDLLPNKEVPTAEELNSREAFIQKRKSLFKKRPALNIKNLEQSLKSNRSHPHWEELAKKCLSCSACTAVCPTCFCFDVWDEATLNGLEGDRLRRWDSCQLQGFSKVASGEIFRKERRERVRHRFLRKFVYLKERFGENYCVGCGRCGRACPVAITIPEVIEEISKPCASTSLSGIKK